MAKLKDIDLSRTLTIGGMAYDIDSSSALRYIEGCDFIKLNSDEAKAFMKYLIDIKKWRIVLEEDLQCIAKTNKGEPLLDTWMPLVDFRYKLCSENLNASEETLKVLQKLFVQTRSWRDKGVDTVEIDGFRK